MDMCFLSEAERGVLVDDHEGVHPDILQQFYGVEDVGQVNVDDSDLDAADEDLNDANEIFNGLQE